MQKNRIDNVEMAFIYGIVTLALESNAANGSEADLDSNEDCVASLLTQAGYSVDIVNGKKNLIDHIWFEVGHQGSLFELILDLSNPKSPLDTVIRIRSKKASESYRKMTPSKDASTSSD